MFLHKGIKRIKIMKKNIINKGFSLIEILLVLSIIFIAAVVSFVVYQKTSEEMKINNTISQIASINSVIDYLPPNLENVDLNRSIQNSGIFDEMTTNENKMINEWGGNIHVSSRSVKNNHFYDILYYSLPTDACIKLTQKLGGMYTKVEDLNGSSVSLNSIPNVIEFCENNNSKENALVLSSFYTEGNSLSKEKTKEELAQEEKEKLEAEKKEKEEKAKQEAEKKANEKIIKKFANDIVFQWDFDLAEQNNYQSNSFSFMVDGRPYFVQGPRDVIKEFYTSIVNAKNQEELKNLTKMEQLPTNLYSIKVGDSSITATYITDSSREYYQKWFKQASYDKYKQKD